MDGGGDPCAVSRREPLVVKTRTATAITRINTASATKPDVCMTAQ
jgi:hypothetical protein